MDTLPGYLGGLLGILLLTAFVKILTSLSILRLGIGLNSGGFGLVIVAISLSLSLLVVSPQLESMGGVSALFNGQGWKAPAGIEDQFRPFLKKNTQAEVLKRLTALAERLQSGGAQPVAGRPEQKQGAAQPASGENVSFPVLMAAFLVSQLKEAFQIGFVLLLPFLVVDLLVTNILLALGVTQISQAVVSLPLKLLLFFAVDGWTLVSEKLIGGYL